MTMFAALLTVPLFVSPMAEPQPLDDLQVTVRGLVVQSDGGEQGRVFNSTGSIVIGKTTTSAIAMNECGHLSVSGGAYMLENPVNVWRIEVTPIRVQNRAVTLRLDWKRSMSGGKEQQTPVTTAELTLRPGESVPIDTVAVAPPAVKPSGRVCDARSVTIRAGVDNYPDAEQERRLIASDVWLIEKLTDGTERSQQAAIRERPHQPATFFFDTISDGGVSLDFFGDLMAAPRSDGIAIHLETRSRLIQGGQSSLILRQGNMMTAREVKADLTVKPGEVVDVALPRLSENESGAFANRSFSIRIRSRQLR